MRSSSARRDRLETLNMDCATAPDCARSVVGRRSPSSLMAGMRSPTFDVNTQSSVRVSGRALHNDSAMRLAASNYCMTHQSPLLLAALTSRIAVDTSLFASSSARSQLRRSPLGRRITVTCPPVDSATMNSPDGDSRNASAVTSSSATSPGNHANARRNDRSTSNDRS